MAVIQTKSRNALSSLLGFLSRQGVWIALITLIVIGGLRYNRFLSEYNIESFLRYNSMFALIALGMAFVIMTGGIDLSVGSVVAFSSVISALVSPYGVWPALLAAVLASTLLGFINGLIITRLNILPFITTLAMMLAARGAALTIAKNQSIGASYESNFIALGQGNWLGFPIPAWIMFGVYIIGMIVLSYTSFGRHVLALGGNEEATRLMGLPINRIKILVYTISGMLAGLAGVILASQFGAGQPTEGLGWELSAIASVVVGGTLLTGGLGTVGGTLAGALLLGLIFNMLNFENGKGIISLSSYWQSVIRGFFLLLVVILQNRLARRVKG
jgi:galactofuranose transport system permease protein